MSPIHRFITRLERRLHPKIKEGIAKSLVYYFALKESRAYQQARYHGHPHLLERFQGLIGIAHRGFSGRYPENTLLAFEKALEHKADLLELDLQLSQDGVLVVCHDPHLQRLAGVDYFVRDLPYARLRALDLGVGQHLPTLAELFETLPSQTAFLLEVKHEATRFLNWEFEKLLLQTIREHGRSEQVVIAAFNPMVVNRIRKLAPEISTLYLITQTLNPLLIWLLGRIRPRYLSVDMRYLSRCVVKRLQGKGIQVLGYTLNTPAEYQRACELGLVGVTTDHPERLRAFLVAQATCTKTELSEETRA